MECQLTKGIQRPKAAHLSLALSSGLPDSLVAETHSKSAKGSMYRESTVVSSTLTVPEATPFSLKSSESFYSQPSWTGSEAWPFEKSVASSAAPPFSTLNVSRSHLPVAPSSAQQNSYSSSATSGVSDLTMMDSSWISSLSSKESTLPHPSPRFGEKRGKEGKVEKETKLGKMYKRASKSTKAISRLLFHSPPSGGGAKCSSPRAPLVIPSEEDHVVDPFASGRSVASYGLSPVEPGSPTSHLRAKSFPEVNSAKSQFLTSSSVSSPLGISDPPSLRKSNQVLEGKSIRGPDIPFPFHVGNSSSMSLSPPAQRPRSNSMSTTRVAKPFYNYNPTPMPHMFPAITAEPPSVPGDLHVKPLPSPPFVSPPESITHLRANSLSETRFQITVQPTKAVLLTDDARSSSINGGMPLPAIPMRDNDHAHVVQTQAQFSDADSNVEMQRKRVASSPSISSLRGKHLKSSLDASAGQRRPAGNNAKDMGPIQELQTCSKPESLSRSLPPAVASGISERVSRRRGSGSKSFGDLSPAPSYQQHQSVAKPVLHSLSTQNLSPSAYPSDSKKLVSGSLRSQQYRLPRSPSLPDLRPNFADAPPVPKLRANLHSEELRRLPQSMHARSPSLPTLSRDPENAFMPQALPTSIVDRLKSRGRDFPRLISRLSSTDSVSSSKSTSIITEKAITSGTNCLTLASNHSQSVGRDARSRTLSHVAIRPSVLYERIPSTLETPPSTSSIGHTHIPVRPSVPGIQSSASKIQPFPSPTTSLLPQARRCLKSPSVPDLRARATTSSPTSGDSHSQPSSPPSPDQNRHVPSYSHSQSILVPPLPPIPANYKPQAPTNAKPETAPPFHANFFRPRPNPTRPKEISYPPTKKAEKLFHARSNKEMAKEDDMGFMETPRRPPKAPSVMIPSSPIFDRRRMSHKFRSFSMKGQGGDDIPPVPPLPSSPPVLALPVSRIRNVPSRDRMTIGAAF